MRLAVWEAVRCGAGKPAGTAPSRAFSLSAGRWPGRTAICARLDKEKHVLENTMFLVPNLT